MYSSYSLEYFVHTLAHATGTAQYQIETIVTDAGYEAAYRAMYETVAQRNRWDNDGFTSYIRFRMTNNNTRESHVAQYNFDDTFRKFVFAR